MSPPKNNDRTVILIIAIILMLCSLPAEWMVIHQASMTPNIPGGFPGAFPGFGNISLSVTGLTGHITLGAKFPIWFIVLIGAAGLVLVFLNLAGITQLPRAAALIPLCFSLLFVMLTLGIGVGSDGASLGFGGFIALVALGLGLWILLSQARFVPLRERPELK